MEFVSEHNMHHGDIRNDHIFIEAETGVCKWIDFDYSVTHADYDFWSLGNLIIFTAAGGLLLHKDISQNPDRYPRLTSPISAGDCSLYHKYRVANVRKVYPYISKKINHICMRHAIDHIAIYEDYPSLIHDLEEAYEEIQG